MAQRYFRDGKLEKVLSSAGLIVFDMNGLIVHDEPLHWRACSRVLDSFDVDLTEEVFKNKWTGRHVDKNVFRTLDALGVDRQTYNIRQLVREKNRLCREELSRNVKEIVRPGVEDLIRYVSVSSRHHLALATSAMDEEVEMVLGEHGLNVRHLFEHIVTGSDISPDKGKPDPETYLRAIDPFRVDPSNALAFEDTNPGVESALNAGMKVFAVPSDYTLSHDFSSATYVVDNLTPQANVITLS